MILKMDPKGTSDISLCLSLSSVSLPPPCSSLVAVADQKVRETVSGELDSPALSSPLSLSLSSHPRTSLLPGTPLGLSLSGDI